MRLTYLLFILLIFAAPVSSQDLPSVERAERTALLLDQLYRDLGPEAGSILYDPCYVITFGELRPLARWNGFKARSPEVESALEDLNKRREELGFAFSVSDGGLAIRSLEGLIDRSRSGEYPWATPFPIAGDFEDWATWEKEQRERVTEYCKSQGYSAKDIDFHFLEGFRLGYPELAVRRYMTRSDDPYHHSRAINVGVAFRQELDNGEPSYNILPEDCLAPEIAEHVEKWSSFLQAFYELPQVRERVRSKEFLEARRKVNPEVDHSRTERWWRGEKLKWIWTPSSQSLTRAHECVLYRHIDEIEQLLEKGRPLDEIVLACQEWAFDSPDTKRARFSGLHLRDWFWWGGWSNQGPRGRFYRALAKAQPTLFAVECRERLNQTIRWSQRGERDTWDSRRASLLYRHPEFQRLFPKLDHEQRAFVFDDILENLEAKEFKHLVQEARLKGADSVYAEVVNP